MTFPTAEQEPTGIQAAGGQERIGGGSAVGGPTDLRSAALARRSEGDPS